MVLRRNVNIIYLDVEVIKVFMPSPFVAFKSSQNLRSFRSQKSIHEKKTVDFSKRGSKRRHVYLNVSETDLDILTFEYFQTKRQYKIININLMMRTNV